ncbi:MAG TPA: hypothetical protein VE338_15965, partial [Ktedonobacterales bacterium]|nr:hypothetical protein [Ktedonobacterales bacterium]
PAQPDQPGQTARRALVACRYFVEEELTVAGTMREPACPSSCRILTVLRGELEILPEAERGTSQGEPVRLKTGETAVLPACLGDATLSGSATLVRSYVPEPDDPTLALWQAAHAGLFPSD